MPKKGAFKDYAGRRFGRLVAVSFAARKHHNAVWLFRCDRGSEVEASISNVIASSRSHSPRKKTSAPNTALAIIASHKARGVVSWCMREIPSVQRTNKLRTTQTHTM